MSIAVAGGQLNLVQWIAEGRDLLLGTSGSFRSVGQADTTEAFSATNAKQKKQSSVGASRAVPVSIEGTLVFVDRFGERLHEAAPDINAPDGYATPELTILSSHLPRQGVVELDYQRNPGNLIWAPLLDGRLLTVTYEKAQQVVGCAQQRIAGGSADAWGLVESVCVIPATGGDQVWMVVKRTIGGSTVRYVEYLADPFNTETDLEDAIFGDSAITYDGSATGTVSGALHLAGETVGVLADGIDIGDATVSASGTVTLPSGVTASKITIGLRYLSRAETLRLPQAGNQDGSALGRLKRINEVVIDMMDTAGLEAGTETATEEVALRSLNEALETAQTLMTGTFRVFSDDSWRNGGSMVMENESMYPTIIRAVMAGTEGEP